MSGMFLRGPVQTALQYWKVRDKRRFLLAMMEKLEGDAQISFEGDLSSTKLLGLPRAVTEETEVLKRNTSWPKQDFVIVPLERSLGATIIQAIGGTVPQAIIHVQIQKNNSLEFGAYDSFSPECLKFGKAVTRDFLDSLVAEGILSPWVPKRTRETKA